MVRLNRRVGYNRDTYILCRLCDRVVMIPEQVRRKLDAGQGHIVGQVAVHFPVEQVGQIRAAQVEAGSQRGKGQVLLQMQVDIVDDIADDHRIAGGRVPRYPVTILLQHLDHKGLLLLLGGDFTGGEQIIVIRGKICVVYPGGCGRCCSSSVPNLSTIWTKRRWPRWRPS